jgi:hypothetical protein
MYEDNLRALEKLAASAKGNLRDRLGTIFHDQVDLIRPQRDTLGAIAARLLDAREPVSAFSKQTHAARERGVKAIEKALDGVAPDLRPLAANALWLMMLSSWLFYLSDEADGKRTHAMIDELLDTAVMLLPWFGTPFVKPMIDRIAAGFDKVGIKLT